ncbi:MAG: FHA domain-containing protein [Archangium sp.]|nr:FHA domain-containing protein [Archangium sp.]
MTALVIQVEDTQSKRRGRFVFERSPVHVGRSELNDLVLPLQVVSLWHGVVRFTGDAVSYVDTGSRNGSVLNGKVLKGNQSTPVAAEQRIAIGPLQLKFSIEEPGRIDNSGQRQQLFGGVTADTDQVSGHTRFVHLREAETAKGLHKGEAKARISVQRSPGVPPSADPESTALVAKHVPLSADVPATDTDNFPLLEQAHGQYLTVVASVQRQLATLLRGKSDAERRMLLAKISAKYPKLVEGNLLLEWGKKGGTPPSGRAGLASSSVFVNDGLLGGVSATPSPQRAVESIALRLLNQFAQSYVSKRKKLEAEFHIERFLDRVAQLLETFSKAFIELRRGYDSFGEQMGVGAGGRRDSKVNSAESIQKLLEYVMDESQSDERVAEVTRGFADLMIHQVALMGGIREGVKAVLRRVSPESIEALARRKGGSSLINAIVPAQRNWTLYGEQLNELLNDEEKLSQILFGKSFARAYATLAHGDGQSEEGDDE